jgi:hypothetical protein
MTAVRKGAWVVLRYVTALFFIGVIVQFFLVGYGLFRMRYGSTIDNATSLDAHRDFGWHLSLYGAAFMLIFVLLAWPRAKLLVQWIVLAVLAFVQGILASVGFNHWVLGMFHPVNALILLGLSFHLARYAWKSDRDAGRSPAATVAT